MSEEEKTANELVKSAEQEVMDGFDAYGDELDQRLLQGMQIKFTNAYTWVTRAGDEVPTDVDFIAADVKRVEAYWTKDKNAPPKTRVLLSGEKFRDMKKLNEETPKSEWREYNGQLKGPWENQHYLYLLDRLMKKYTYVASTIGGNIAVPELVQQVKDARLAYGPDVYAKVRLSDTWMKTSHSKDGRQRPHFIITGYTRRRGGGGGEGGGRLVELPDLTESGKLEHLDKPTAKQTVKDEIAY
jgi:hypothetical protein